MLLILARALNLMSSAVLVGIPTVLTIAVLPAIPRQARAATERLPILLGRLFRFAWAALAIWLPSLCLWLLLEAAAMSGGTLSEAATPATVGAALWRTQFGHTVLARLVLAIGLGVCLALASPARRTRLRDSWLRLGSIFSSLGFVALVWAGHAAATPGLAHFIADAAHLLAAGVWLGGLVVLAVLFGTGANKSDAGWIAIIAAATRRFSLLGIVCVGILLVSGIVNSWFLVGTIPALLGTAYGHLLLVKIALFALMLWVASVNRWRLTPLLGTPARRRGNGGARQALRLLRRNAAAELILGFLVLAVVSALGAVTPGLHEEPWWPFAYRLGSDAMALPEVRVEIVIALAAIVIGSALCLAGLAWRRHRMPMILVGVTLVIGFLPSFRVLLVVAYPTSFFHSPVAYTTDSIARGFALYPDNCAACHGAHGKGDGPAAAALKVPPADLTAAHVLDHSVGDIFWWLTKGVPESGMPGFADRLSEDDRWDLINWVRTMPASGELTDTVGDTIPLPAPDFAFEMRDGRQDTLRNRLSRGPLLLVFPADASASTRLRQLAAARPALAQKGLDILVITAERKPDPAGLPDDMSATASVAAAAGYRLMAGGPDSLQDPPPADLEFLIDRDGYARATWRSDLAGGWQDIDRLMNEVARLDERRLASPAAVPHVH
jgi:putative copper export protein/mono/diheme cytochrome c family protein